MLLERKDHTVLIISNKMYIVGGDFLRNSCEVFDSITRKFTFIKTPPNWMKCLSTYYSVSVGYNIYCFVREEYGSGIVVYRYNIQKKVFDIKTCLKIENTSHFSCTKVPFS